MSIEIEYMMHKYHDVMGTPDYELREAEAETYSIEQINDRLLEIHKQKKEEYDGEFYLLLSTRQRKLNDAFEWTDENIAKFVQINQKLMYCIQKLNAQKKVLEKEAEERISKEPSLGAIDVMTTISPKILQWDEEWQDMDEPSEGIYCLLDEIYDDDLHLPLHGSLKFDLNWNTMVRARNDELKDYYICYGMHELYDHTLWSLQDIIQINGFWTDIYVQYYHCGSWESKSETLVLNKNMKTEEIKELLLKSKNMILIGGDSAEKAHLAKQIAESMEAEVNFVKHNENYNYNYADFVEGVRPMPPDENGNIGFERKDGVFKAFCTKALLNLVDSQKSQEPVAKKNFVFIIDGFYYRDDVSKIFGELLLPFDPEYRGTEGALQTQLAKMQTVPNAFDIALGYTDKEADKYKFGHFFIPENVYIIGFASVRSIEWWDFEQRRQFAWVEIKADGESVQRMSEINN